MNCNMGDRMPKNMKKFPANIDHQAFRADVSELLKRYAGKLDATEFLAVTAHMVGQIIAFQDQRTVTREIAVDIVISNIGLGNQEVVEDLQNTKGQA